MTETTSFPLKGDRFIQFVPAAEKQRTSRCFSLQFEVPALNVDVSFSSSFCQENHTEGSSANTSKRNQSMKCYSQPSACRLPLPFYLANCRNHLIYLILKRLSVVLEIEVCTSQQQRKFKESLKLYPCS